MSSKKKSISATLDQLVVLRLDEEKQAERRSRSAMLEKILVDRYNLSTEISEVKHANEA